MAHPDDVLDYWFADARTSPAAAEARNAFWFATDPATDKYIWEHFGDVVTDAAGGHYDYWTETARGRLALIIVLDQFPRNIYRGTAEVFRCDGLAISLARDGVSLGQLAGLSVPEQAFFLMPYQHSEDIEDQRAGVELNQGMIADAADEWSELPEYYAGYAVLHHDIIESFGRFPHRNRVLGRQSTEAETQYLAEGGHTFGQAG